MSIGGSLESIAIAGRTFPVAADSDVNFDLGGKSNDVQPNGDGSTRTIQTRKPWKIEGAALQIDDTRGDLEFLQGIADGKADVPITAVKASGVIYQGTGQITNDLIASSQSATAKVTLSGPGKLTPQ